MNMYIRTCLHGSGLQVAIWTEWNQQSVGQIEYTPALAVYGRLCALLYLTVGCQNRQLLQLCHFLVWSPTNAGKPGMNTALVALQFCLGHAYRISFQVACMQHHMTGMAGCPACSPHASPKMPYLSDIL